MKHLDISENIYPAQLENGSLLEIRKLAKQALRRRTDNNRLQAKALDRWTRSETSMREFLLQSKTKIEEFQLSKMRNLVDNAYANVPFYHDIYSTSGYEKGSIRSFSDFTQLPIITKKMLNSFDARIRLNDPAAIELSNTSRTSGSSGNPFTVYSDDDDIILDHLQVMRFYNSCLKTPLQPSDWVYMLHHSGLAFSSLEGKYRTFQLPDLYSSTPLGQHLKHLRPRLLITLPSYLPLILQHKNEIKLSGVEAILTNSEGSTRDEREYYSKELGLPIFDEYSSEEIGMIATQCTHGQYHVIEDGVYLEIVDFDNDGFGSVVCTDLNNEMMPLIRFDHGDIAKKSSAVTPCACGSFCTSLGEIDGRRDDAFRTRTHKLVPSASLLAAVDDVLITPDKTLVAFRLVQKDSETVLLITHFEGKPYKNMSEILSELKARLSALFGYQITLLHQETNNLPEQKSYKRRCIIREWALE
jgi:phenylacetate-CoA ligase